MLKVKTVFANSSVATNYSKSSYRKNSQSVHDDHCHKSQKDPTTILPNLNLSFAVVKTKSNKGEGKKKKKSKREKEKKEKGRKREREMQASEMLPRYYFFKS